MIPNNTPEFIERLEREYDTIFNIGMTKMSKNEWNKYDFDSMSRDQLLVLWNNLTSTLETVKKNEMELRKYIVAREFPKAEEGVNSVQIGNGYELKATVKFTYNLDNKDDKVNIALDEIAKTGNEGNFIAERLVSWKPSLSIKEYRELEPQYKKIIDKVLTIKDAAPTLEIKEPKGK